MLGSTLEKVRFTASRVVIFNLWIFLALGIPVGYFSAASTAIYWVGMIGMFLAATTGTLYLRTPRFQKSTEYVIPLLYFAGGGMLIVAAGGVNHTIIDPLYISFGVLGFAVIYCSPKTMVMMVLVGFSHHGLYQLFWSTGLYAEGVNLFRFGWHGVWWSVIGISSLIAGAALKKVLETADATHKDMMKTVETNRALESENAEAELARLNEEKAREKRENEREIQHRIEAKRLEDAAHHTRVKEMADLADSFEKKILSLIDGVVATSKNLVDLTGKVSHCVAEAKTTSEETLLLSDQSTNETDAVAAATEELSASIRSIQDQSQISQDKSLSAYQEIQTGAQKAEALKKAATVIDNVTLTIQDLSNKTNLLALNATIEAASAGEAGRGFAVVASEVKMLANQTNAATGEIKGQVEELGSSSQEVIAVIEGVRARMADVEAAGLAVADSVYQQSQATAEIAARTQKNASLGQAVAERISGISCQVNEASQTMEMVASASDDMAIRAESMRKSVVQFLEEIRKDAEQAAPIANHDNVLLIKRATSGNS
ncbi:MAG: hypothetical protein JKY57_02425 [Kordiimonadaceae bacterium]|nr:hypothetical protein [Kordiimonadaceae bacterium]